MIVTGKLYGGSDKERFVVTRSQLRDLEKRSYMSGVKSGFHVDRFLYERKVTPADDWGAEQVARAKWLHIVTANHLRKARAELNDLRLDNESANAELRLWRGSEPSDRCVPDHYAGDGLVTCSRAMESASAQVAVVPQSAMQLWWWMCAFKYVWRMWSKDDPVKDANKAIDCLGKVIHAINVGKSGDEGE